MAFQPHGAAPSVPANVGVRLSNRGTSMLVIPRRLDGKGDMESYAPFELPRIFAGMVERAGGIARCFWRRHRRSFGSLLYLDLETRLWAQAQPPLLCSPADIRLNVTFGQHEKPPDTWRLAGSFRSLPNHSIEEATLSIPPFDGLHLIFDPCGGWLMFTAIIHADGQCRAVPADGVIIDEYEHLVDAIGDRVWLADHL